MRIKPRRWGLMALLALWSACGFAHKPSDSYLTLTVTPAGLYGQWDIALRDLDYALGLDANGDGAITWGELRRAEEAVFSEALAHLAIKHGSRLCSLHAKDLLVDQHADGGYAVLAFTADCMPPVSDLAITYSLFFALDAQHRGLLNLRHGRSTRTAVFSNTQRELRFDLDSTAPWQDFAHYVREGTRHIGFGYDHILFLLSLLLPAVLHRQQGAWIAASSFRETLVDVMKIVTAFTLAHSLTLSLAALDMVRLPSRWVETAIAGSIVVAALTSRSGVVHRARWIVAFAFGLLHGFGFASVLLDLGLPAGSRTLALVGFNLGVELGQLAIVSLFLPSAFLARHSRFYRLWALQAGTLVIAVLGMLWMIQRGLDLSLGGWWTG